LAVVNNLIARKVIGQLSDSYTLRRYSEALDRRRREVSGEICSVIAPTGSTLQDTASASLHTFTAFETPRNPTDPRH
ncbi:hypothetical protein ACC743_40165, partial [Rhizobium ruizarguesonis]